MTAHPDRAARPHREAVRARPWTTSPPPSATTTCSPATRSATTSTRSPSSARTRSPRPRCVLPGSSTRCRPSSESPPLTDVPLWTVSRGKNYGYGGASPRVAGQRRGRPAPAGPGARGRRRDRLRPRRARRHVPGAGPAPARHRLPLMPSVPDIGWGSVIGNTLERGFGYTAHGDHSAFQCGHGGRPRRRHPRAHRHGRQGRSTAWAHVQGRLRALRRRAVLPVQPRHRHQDGRLADAPPGELRRLHGHDPLATTTSPRWSTRCDRCCSTAPCRATSSSGTPRSSPRWSPRARLVGRPRPAAGRGDRPDHRRHGHRPVERPLRALRSSRLAAGPAGRRPPRVRGRLPGARARVTHLPGRRRPGRRCTRPTVPSSASPAPT